MVHFSNTSAASIAKNKQNLQKFKGLKLEDQNVEKLVINLGITKKATKTPKGGSQGISQGLFAYNVGNRTKHKPTGSLVGINENK
jgi:hypothetical protein